MIKVAIIEETTVAVNTPPASIPVADSMPGFTARIYAIVMNVVIPARTSVFTVVLCSFSLKKFSTD